jgi:two-component system chemotaxis response regulator CheB
VVGLVASAGGLRALREILSALPATFPAALAVVQHTSPRHKSYLAQVLARRTDLRVKEAAEGDRLRPGEVFVAPPDRHLIVNPDGTLSLSHAGRVRHVRPSGDVLFASMAVSYRDRAVAVVLTGGDHDGSTGARLVKAVGGTVVAQDEATSEQFAMPSAAIATGAVDHVLPLGQIAPILCCLTIRGSVGVGQGSDFCPRGACGKHGDGAGCDGRKPRGRAEIAAASGARRKTRPRRPARGPSARKPGTEEGHFFVAHRAEKASDVPGP